MQDKLHDHLIFLEEKIQAVSDQLTSPRLSAQERDRYETELRIAETALAHYRAAYDAEQILK